MKYFSFMTEQRLKEIVDKKVNESIKKIDSKLALLTNRLKNIECRLDIKERKKNPRKPKGQPKEKTFAVEQ